MTPSPDNLYLGAGDVLFDRFDVDGNPTGLRHLGNVSALDITTTVTTVEKKSDMQGVRGTYKMVVTGTTSEFALTLDEFDPQNLALALLGDQGELTQAANPTITDQDIAGGADLIADVWYDLGAINPTVTAVTQTTALDPAAYVIDAEGGLIKFLSSYTDTGAFVPGPATWSGSTPAITTPGLVTIDALANASILGHLHYKSASDQVSGPRVIVDVWSLMLSPNGALKMIDPAFGQITLKGSAMQDTTRPLGQQYYRVVYL